MNEVFYFYPILIKGTITTIELTVLGAILALVISFIVGISRISSFKSIRVVAIIYLEFFRGSSALVQMFFIYFVLPMWGIYFDALTAGVIACGCNVGAYGSEVVRGAILAVDKDQHEASKALNYSSYKKYRYVIIPQAIPIMIPTFGNLLIELLKLTAVASLITISDLTFMAHIIRVQTALTLEPFLVILVIYFIIASVLVKIVDLIAKKFSKGRNIMTAGEK
jgi:polar amino acid transport system permease protein|tara:strand:- start:1698 stop:2366 length:669 start_codon:yes stop_codon:yes gene_type:complete